MEYPHDQVHSSILLPLSAINCDSDTINTDFQGHDTTDCVLPPTMLTVIDAPWESKLKSKLPETREKAKLKYKEKKKKIGRAHV